MELTKAKARRPTSFELGKRVVAAINEFMARSERQECLASVLVRSISPPD